MNVSACLVTRGDVEMQPIIDSLPREWEIVIWDNGEKMVTRSDGYAEVCTDLSVYGRYAAIEHASHDLIYVQDDDVIVSDPQAIVDRWERANEGHLFMSTDPTPWGGIVANQPQEFRHDFYTDHALVGFGAAFHRDAPARVFSVGDSAPTDFDYAFEEKKWKIWAGLTEDEIDAVFHRTCDIVFTGLTPRVLVDVPKQDLDYASAPNRMWKQSEHIEKRTRMLDLVRKVRDA